MVSVAIEKKKTSTKQSKVAIFKPIYCYKLIKTYKQHDMNDLRLPFVGGLSSRVPHHLPNTYPVAFAILLQLVCAEKTLAQLLFSISLEKTFIKSINPQADLLLKIIGGDSSDNIPAIKKRCGKAGALKILNDGIDVHLINDEIKSNYERNVQLINLDCIPQHIKTSIIDQYTNYKTEKYDGMAVFNFLIKNKINRFIDELQTIWGPMLRRLS